MITVESVGSDFSGSNDTLVATHPVTIWQHYYERNAHNGWNSPNARAWRYSTGCMQLTEEAAKHRAERQRVRNFGSVHHLVELPALRIIGKTYSLIVTQ